MSYSSAVSSVAPLSRTVRERCPAPKAAAPKTADIIDTVSVVGNQCPVASIHNNNTPGQDKRGIQAVISVATPTVTGELVQTTATVDGGNQGLYHKIPGKALTTMDTDTIVEGNNSSPGQDGEIAIDPRNNGAKSCRVP
jgi:hypothetical protein